MGVSRYERFILFSSSTLNSINMYYFNDDKLVVSQNGLTIPIVNRDVKLSNFSFKIRIDANTTKDIFIQIKSNNNKSFAHTIHNTSEEFYEVIYNQKFIFIFLSGIVFIILLLTIILYFNTKDKKYFIYFIYSILGYVSILFLNTYMQYILYSQYYFYYLTISSNLLIIFSISFFNKVLNLKYINRSLYKYFNFLFVLFIALLTINLFAIFEFGTLLNSISIIFATTTISFGLIYATVKKIRMAKFLLVGWLFYIAGILSIIFKVTGIYTSVYSISIFQIMVVIDMLVFTLMLLYMLKLNIKDSYKKEILLEKQSKFVIIGETFSNIEHQWRTPLSKISSNIAALEHSLEYQDMPTKENLLKSLKNIDTTIIYMLQLIKNFKEFYKEDKEIQTFHINFALSSALQLLDYELNQHNIKLKQNIKDDYTIRGNLNELIQVFLNIIGNSKDILVQRETKNPYISVSINKIENKIIIEIKDNAGGINDENINIIFEQFYSLKDNQSTGIGLYISKQIIEKKIGGILEVKNLDDGACFSIIIKSK